MLESIGFKSYNDLLQYLKSLQHANFDVDKDHVENLIKYEKDKPIASEKAKEKNIEIINEIFSMGSTANIQTN